MGPVIKITSPPKSLAFFAIAYPILPVERFVINLTGSIFSTVGPAVTNILYPLSFSSKSSSYSILLTISSVFASFPAPTSPQASLPESGFINKYPNSFKFDSFFL